MELSTLKRYRKIVPGLLSVFFSAPLLFVYAPEVLNYEANGNFEERLVGTLITVVIFSIGTLFDNFKWRGNRLKHSADQINYNIKSRLIDISTADLSISNQEKEALLANSDRRLMRVFYRIVDNDNSLQEQSKIVKDNGAFWTSSADVALLSLVFTIIYFLLALIDSANSIFFMIFGLLIGLLGLVSGLIIHPKVTKSHIKLSNEQLDTIAQFHTKEVVELIKPHIKNKS